MKVLVTGGTGVLGRAAAPPTRWLAVARTWSTSRIVGVDRAQVRLLSRKARERAADRDSGLPWTILRATEFHDLMLTFLIKLSKAPVAVVARGGRFHPVDVRDVAQRMADLVLSLLRIARATTASHPPAGGQAKSVPLIDQVDRALDGLERASHHRGQ